MLWTHRQEQQHGRGSQKSLVPSTRALMVKFLKRIRASVTEEGASSPKFLEEGSQQESAIALIPRQEADNGWEQIVTPL